jgi:S1-C subfamily serine protease
MLVKGNSPVVIRSGSWKSRPGRFIIPFRHPHREHIELLMRNTASALAALALVAAIIFTACYAREPGPVAVARPSIEPFELKPEEKNLVQIFRDAAPSVVFISTNALVRRGFSGSAEEVPAGTGSGFIWDKNGHILTNYHVVHEYVQRRGRAVTLTVQLSDRKRHKAEVVGVFPDKELAVLKIEAPGAQLQPIRLGQSGDLVVGQTAIAIGNPFGLDHTLTVGVISALGREIQALTGRRITDVIQTDAAINPGNSGGPLLNSSGQLIGMNTAIISPSGVNAGIGFAIPVDTILRYADQIVSRGKITGPGLGIEMLSDHIARRLGVRGVVIGDVVRGGSAANAGLQGTKVYTDGTVEVGDIITAVGGKKVTDIHTLRDVLEPLSVGDEVEVAFIRDGRERKVKLRLQEVEME